jgi:hypothetical protein
VGKEIQFKRLSDAEAILPIICSSSMKTASELGEPEAVVQRQLDAYNARDVAALLAAYADDAQSFEHPAKLLASGSVQLGERFRVRFQEPNLHATLVKRIVMRNIVVDHEKVTRTFPEGPGMLELLMIYDVQNGRIAKAWSIVGPKMLDEKS